MDAYIESKLAAFADLSLAELKNLPKHERNRHFERFVNLHVIRYWFLPNFTTKDVDHISTGDTDDNQIDGYGILIGGRLVPRLETDQQTIRHALSLLEAADDDAPISFVFVQSTTATSFARKKMVATVTGANDCLDNDPYVTENVALISMRGLKSAIAERIGGAASPRVVISVFYVALGRWDDLAEVDSDGAGSRSRAPLGWRKWAENSIRKMTGCVNAPNVEVIDLARLKRIIEYNELVAERANTLDAGDAVASVEPISRKIEAPTLLPIPLVAGVAHGYIGYVRADEYLKLLERDDGLGIIDDISFSNVRTFQGIDNAVNSEIAATLAGDQRPEFILLNNGVTIVASAADWSNGRLTLTGYQIVNGLQTSTILYRQRGHLEAGTPVHVPLKLVVTGDRDLLERVGRATNRQSAITDLQQESQSPFVLRLWRAFEAARLAGDGEPLWLERRAGEYDDAPPHADGLRIISLEELLAAATSSYLRQPYVASTGVAALKAKVPDQLFGKEHRPYPYLVAARLSFRVKSWRRSRNREDLDRFLNFLCFGLYYLAIGETAAFNFRDPQAESLLRELDRRLGSADLANKALDAVAAELDEIIAPLRQDRGSPKWRDAVRTRGLVAKPLEQRLLRHRNSFDWGE